MPPLNYDAEYSEEELLTVDVIYLWRKDGEGGDGR